MDNRYYTVEPIFENVSKEEFSDWLSKYPRKLERDVYAVVDPPAVSYNDFELADKWPYSIVARTSAYSEDPKDYFYEPPEDRIYSVMRNFEEVYLSKTGHKGGV